MQMRIKNHIQTIFVDIALLLIILQASVIIGSWISAAAMPESSVRSLISSDGIRWFFGMFINNIETRVLVWIILFGFSWGTFCNSGLCDLFNNKRIIINTQTKFGLKIIGAELICFVLIMLLLTITPHALLLSVTGELFPSSFSRSFLPVLAFSICIFSISFGVATGKINSIIEGFKALTYGINQLAPVLFIYVLAAQLYSSVIWIMQW
jgi:aminobenzoyl-glutamate transport protein